MPTEFNVYDGSAWRRAKEAWVFDGSAWRKSKSVSVFDGSAWRTHTFMDSPTEIANLGFWWEAHKMGLAHGASVSTMTNYASTSYEYALTDGTAATINNNALAGYDTLIPDAAGSAYATGMGGRPDYVFPEDYTFFAVINPTGNTNLGCMIGADRAASGPRIVQFRINGTTQLQCIGFADDSTVATATGALISGWQVVAMRRRIGYVDAYVQGSLTNTQTLSPNASGSNDMSWLSRNYFIEDPFNGHIAGLVGYDRALSDSEMDTVHGYLISKYEL